MMEENIPWKNYLTKYKIQNDKKKNYKMEKNSDKVSI